MTNAPEQQPLEAWTDEKYMQQSGRLADLVQDLKREKHEKKEAMAEYAADIKRLEDDIDDLSRELRQQRVVRKKVEAA